MHMHCCQNAWVVNDRKRVNAVVIEFYFTNGSIKMLIRVWAGDQTKKLRNRSSHFGTLCKNNRRATVEAIFAY